MNIQTSLEFLMITSAIGLLVLSSVIQYGGMVKNYKAMSARLPANYSIAYSPTYTISALLHILCKIYLAVFRINLGAIDATWAEAIWDIGAQRTIIIENCRVDLTRKHSIFVSHDGLIES